jgi:hypothetical protein
VLVAAVCPFAPCGRHLEESGDAIAERKNRLHSVLLHADAFPRTSAKYLNHAGKRKSINGRHSVGPCGIGRVLDSDLRVIGFDNLKVVDASAIPDMPENSGPAGTTYMLAEYAAERIIAEARDLFCDAENDDDDDDDDDDKDADKDDGKGQTGKKLNKGGKYGCEGYYFYLIDYFLI